MEHTLHTRAGIGATARIVQHQALEFVRLPISKPLLVVVHRGSKRLRWNGQECLIRAGEAVAIAAGQAFDVANLTPDEGSYEASWLAWDLELTAQYAPANPHSQAIREAQPLLRLEPAFITAFDAACAAISQPDILPSTLARHRVVELLLWLAHHGLHFRPPSATLVSARVQKLLASAPDKRWNVPGVAEALAMSEATLRRRLAEEDRTFSELMIDVRMAHALSLLQSTDRSVTQIALDAGYESASRFAVRFRKRFGFAPTAVRGHQRV